jgi:DNA mismatch repair protein MutS
MHNDKITLRDLSIFSTSGEDVSSLIDKTTTMAGREALRHYIRNPPDTFERLSAMQDVVRWWAGNEGKWTKVISNGTIVLLEKFFESADPEAAPPVGISLVLGAFFQRMLNRNQYTFIQFSLTHLSDFLRGCNELVMLLADKESLPPILVTELEMMQKELQHPLIPLLLQIDKQTPYNTLSRLSFRARRELKNISYRLMEHYARLDAWQSMGVATQAQHWTFPTLLPAMPVRLRAKALYHPLLATPVPYDISFNEAQHFLFLTGANMSGKTTFMRALGVGALLAHLGMGVPAQSMEISFLQGIITNMHVEDNLLKGESYFFAEVQRMKSTARVQHRNSLAIHHIWC